MMIMKKTLVCAMASIIGVAAMTSCSSEADFAEGAKTNDLIQFVTDADPMTRSITTTSSLNEFTVSAFLKQDALRSLYMDKVAVTKVDGSWKTAGEYFWPYNGTMSFFSYAPSSLEVAMPGAADFDVKTPSLDYIAPSNAIDQKDVIYAVNADHKFTGSVASSVVNVNFRHALSQIVFSAKCENANWVVDIADVQIYNVKSKGSYTFPASTTLALTEEGNDVRGNWDVKADLNSYNTGFEAITNIGSATTTLTSSTKLPLLLIPQTSNAWDPKADPKCENKGSYFMIRCKLKQKAADSDNYIRMWPKGDEEAYGYVAVPVQIDWKEGKKYTYIFNFKDGAGFIPPTETGAGEDVVPGSPTLAKITFDVVVDDFTTETTSQVNM